VRAIHILRAQPAFFAPVRPLKLIVRCPDVPRSFPLLLSLCIVGCMPQGSGPSPRAVLVISSKDYSLEKVLEPLESLHDLLKSKIDKKQETIEVGGRAVPEFAQYEIAYWYPQGGSNIYGVGLVKWASDLKGPDAVAMSQRYFVEVYAEDDACALCASVKRSFLQHNISYFSACENPKTSTAYEKIRCGT
jgi:hypothetical protein